MTPGRHATADRVVEHFSREAASYRHASDRGVWGWWRERERREIFRLLHPRRGESMLDAGCGAGYYTGHLLSSGVEVVAMDLSLPMLRQAKRQSDVPAFVGDIEKFTLLCRFDAVLCAGALEFCPHPVRAIRCMARLLGRRGSRLVLMLPADGVPGRLYRRFHARNKLAVRLFSRARIERIAATAGLRVSEWGSVGFNHVVRLAARTGGS